VSFLGSREALKRLGIRGLKSGEVQEQLVSRIENEEPEFKCRRTPARVTEAPFLLTARVRDQSSQGCSFSLLMLATFLVSAGRLDGVMA
jgi:hypothetical protein